MSRYLFVYGTLRRHSSHAMAHFLASRAECVGLAWIAGRLYDLGRYPGLLEPADPADRVEGDLYDLGADADMTLRAMDDYETLESPLPAYFDRQLATVTHTDGTTVEAWVYWYRGDVDERRRIASGRYETGCAAE